MSAHRPLAAALVLTAATAAVTVAPAGAATAPGGAVPAASAHGLWLVLAVFAAGMALLVGVLLGLGRRRPRGEADGAVRSTAPAAPPPPGGPPQPAEGWELAVVTFAGVNGAERAFADVRERAGDQRWMHDVAFVEAHHHGRIALRGTLAGHYLDIHDLTDASPEDGPLLTVVHAGVPEGCSALTALAPPNRVGPVVDALGDRARQVHRHRVTADEASALASAVAGGPITPTG